MHWWVNYPLFEARRYLMMKPIMILSVILEQTNNVTSTKQHNREGMFILSGDARSYGLGNWLVDDRRMNQTV